MSEKAILFEKTGAVATVTMNRPASMNSINQDFIDALEEVLQTIQTDKEILVVVLTGAGRAFCAGGDLPFLLSINGLIPAKKVIAAVGNFVKTISEMNKIFVAMVNGVAAGAGFNLALACDIVIAAKSVKFGQSFAKVGLVPDCGGFYLLPKIVGHHKAKELMLTGDLIDAQEAHRIGVVNKLFDDDQLVTETYKFAQRLAAGAPIAMGLIKKMIHNSDNLSLENSLEMEANLQAICMQTSDNAEGIAAFKEKRQPVFTGE